MYETNGLDQPIPIHLTYHIAMEMVHFPVCQNTTPIWALGFNTECRDTPVLSSKLGCMHLATLAILVNWFPVPAVPLACIDPLVMVALKTTARTHTKKS